MPAELPQRSESTAIRRDTPLGNEYRGEAPLKGIA